MHHQSLTEYEERISEYRTFIEKVSCGNDSGMVIPVPENTNYSSAQLVLAAWAHAVSGGVGCWTTAWIPTVLNTEKDEED